MPIMKLASAAKALERHPATLRKWIAQGCPTVTLGATGRGHGSEVDLAQVQNWRAEKVAPRIHHAAQRDMLQAFTTILVDTVKRDDLASRAGLSAGQAALVVCLLFERAHLNIHREPLHGWPPEIAPYGAICVQWLETGGLHTSGR